MYHQLNYSGLTPGLNTQSLIQGHHMPIILEPLSLKTIEGTHIRQCNVIDSFNEESQNLWFQFDEAITPPKDNDCDTYLMSAIMDAMKTNRDIHVKGSVSAQLLSNLVEYQSVWQKWLPDTYNHVDVTCDDIRKNEQKQSSAIAAFSGGVDATFTAWRHTQTKWSHRSKNIHSCALVHGFDIPLSDDGAFNNVADRSTKTLEDIGLKLQIVKTNFREISKVNWEHSHSCALAAALSNFKAHVGYCLIGSTYAYDALTIPWGSNPITDHLLSSNDFEVIHDGASHSRTEKVQEIAEWDVGCRNLRVCWQGEHNDRNCGRCEKCLRTRLNFLAVGHDVPHCFPKSDIIEDMKRIRITKEGVRSDWVSIYKYAKNKSISEPWVAQIPSAIKRRTLQDRFAPRGSLRRKYLKKIAAMVK